MKEEEFNDFKKKLEDYLPIIPDSVMEFYMQKAGITSSDKNVKKVVSLLSHKFISDVVSTSLQYHKIHQKAAQKDKRFTREKKVTLQVNDLEKALDDVGINISRPNYYM
jgi:transcription initiation factor TFIID subunit 10